MGYRIRLCPCGSEKESWWEYDARGIPLARVCQSCIEAKLKTYRPEVLSDPAYWADEPIDGE